ncbi:hypothetical protein M3Y97_00267300 [Aphelenchoides bicaudatus]|nr:hypothetical protein M3Y97_00267300 [Aphelenchoides bicaudatus]
MNKIKYALAPLMAALFVAGQRVQTEDSNNLPFSTSSQFILPTTISTRSSSRRFDFAFATRTTTTVVPQIAEFIPSMGTNRASIRFITAPTPNRNETTTRIPLIDDDTNNDTANDKMAFKEERPPVTPTTQLPSTVELRRPINSTARPSNHTIHRPLSEKLTFRPNQKIAQPLKALNNKTTNKTTPIHQINKSPVKLIADHGNKTTKLPIHVQTELDPELTELRKRIAAGIAAQKVLRERLKQASSSRLQTTNIQKVFTPVRAKINGVSRRKTANAPKQAGVKITQSGKQIKQMFITSKLFSDLNAKKRFEGRFHYAGHIHTGRAGSPSPVIARRFINALGILPKSQVQVEPGPSAIIDDDKNPNDNLQRTTKFEKMHGQKDAPSSSLELTSTPAFCRRCYKFWRNISTANANRSAIYQYCCTIGQHKGELFKTLRQTVTIH